MSNYLVKLKNGESFSITSEQHQNLVKILTKEKTPAFITINNNAVRTDYIAYVKAEEW